MEQRKLQEALSYRALELKAKRIQAPPSPRDLFAVIQDEFEDAYLLESARGNSRLAEYSFVGFDPTELITVKDGSLRIQDLKQGQEERIRTTDPLKELKKFAPPDSVSGLFRFIGGAVGFISYDAVRYWERLPNGQADDLCLPDMMFGVYRDGIVYDHLKKEIYYYTLGEDRVEEISRIARKRPNPGRLRHSEPRLVMKKSQYESMVAKAQEYIFSGDIFQVVLSKRADINVDGDLTNFYSALSKVNPSPYMYFLKFGNIKVVGSSPEMLLRVDEGRVETFPIAGTRPHIKDPIKNSRLTMELLADPKENAEHVMLVDLARNDVGKVSKYGTVKVPESLIVHQFSHVQHIVSHVVGELRQDADSYDALKAMFPAGTVSGAPKVRAMEIIDELEPIRRGPYAGAVGYFSFNGNADFAITIRTLIAKGERCFIQAGAGIVADSKPESEWRETEAKSAALLKALKVASGEE
jgi:anthranilate synthase component 1